MQVFVGADFGLALFNNSYLWVESIYPTFEFFLWLSGSWIKDINVYLVQFYIKLKQSDNFYKRLFHLNV